MKQFSVSHLLRFSGDVLLAAVSAPIEILQRGKPRYVIMTTEQYASLARLDTTAEKSQSEKTSS